MNILEKKLSRLKRAGQAALIPFITAGDPSLAVTADLIKVIQDSGAAALELGVPFSDPLADGPTIQASYQRAVDKKIDLDGIFRMLKKLKSKTLKANKQITIPLVLMAYYNLLFHYGLSRFAQKAAACGISGVIVPDLPPEEAADWLKAAKKYDLCPIFLVSPVTPKARIKQIVRLSRGFIYYVSLTGTTGARAKLPTDIAEHIKAIKRLTNKPVCVGFGISKPSQVKELSKVADGVIVGSALVKLVDNKRRSRNILRRSVGSFISKLASAANI